MAARKILIRLLPLYISLLSADAFAFSGGIFDRYTNSAANNCLLCHSGGTKNYDAGVIFDSEVSGENVVSPGMTYSFTFSMDERLGVSTDANAAGFNLFVDDGTLDDAGAGARINDSDNQITHDDQNIDDGSGASSSFQWTFDWTAPATPGSANMIYCGLPVNNDNDITIDGNIDCGSINIDISEAPAALNDSASVDENSIDNTINVLSNDDAGASGDTKTITGLCSTGTSDNTCNASAYNGATGSVVLDGTGINNRVSFDPDPDQSATFSFKYKMENSSGQTDTATVTVTVIASADPSSAMNDSAQVNENSNSTLIDVLLNDLPLGGNKSITGICPPASSTANCNQEKLANSLAAASISDDSADNRIVFEPESNQTGTFTMRYRMEFAGETSSALLTVKVVEASVNQPPEITSRPVTRAMEGRRYIYNVTAMDPERETLVYGLKIAPSGARIDKTTGRIAWIPGDNAPQTAAFSVVASELGSNGLTDTQNFGVVVTRVNDQPVITSTAPATGSEEVLYSYQVVVNDPDDNVNGLHFDLSNQPDGMTITNSGLVEWLPGENSAGHYTFKVTVEDGGENGTDQAVEIVELTIADTVGASDQDGICFPIVSAAGPVVLICL